MFKVDTKSKISGIQNTENIQNLNVSEEMKLRKKPRRAKKAVNAIEDIEKIPIVNWQNNIPFEQKYDQLNCSETEKRLKKKKIIAQQKVIRNPKTDIIQSTSNSTKNAKFWLKILSEDKKLCIKTENLLQNAEAIKIRKQMKKNYIKINIEELKTPAAPQDSSKNSNNKIMSTNIGRRPIKSKSFRVPSVHQNVKKFMSELNSRNAINAASQESRELIEYNEAFLYGAELPLDVKGLENPLTNDIIDIIHSKYVEAVDENNNENENDKDKNDDKNDEPSLIDDEIAGVKELIDKKSQRKLKKSKKVKTDNKPAKNSQVWNCNNPNINNPNINNPSKIALQLQKRYMEIYRQRSLITQQMLYERRIFEQTEFFRPSGGVEKLPASAPVMHKCEELISIMGRIRHGVDKYFLLKNFDYFVVGIIGTQGVGKSTLLNLLANDVKDYEHAKRLILTERSIFHKSTERKTTFSGYNQQPFSFYITKNRMILIDTPAVLQNSPKITNNCGEIWDLKDLNNIINLISSCHLVIVVMDHSNNENFLKLLQVAYMLKTPQERTKFCSNHFANILVVKNKTPGHFQIVSDVASSKSDLIKLTDSTEGRLYRETISDSKDWIKEMASEKPNKTTINFPFITEHQTQTQNLILEEAVNEFRRLATTIPCECLTLDGTTLTERRWLYFFAKVVVNTYDFIHNIYDNVRCERLKLPDYWTDRKNFDLAIGKKSHKNLNNNYTNKKQMEQMKSINNKFI